MRHILCEKQGKARIEPAELQDTYAVYCVYPHEAYYIALQVLEALSRIQAGENFDSVRKTELYPMCVCHLGSSLQAHSGHIPTVKNLSATPIVQSLLVNSTLAQVAQQCSEDKARQGGDLGWKTRQEVVGAFAEAAFKLNVRANASLTRCRFMHCKAGTSLAVLVWGGSRVIAA